MQLLRLSAVLCLALAGSLALTRPAAATREYARAEGKECIHCHMSDQGSGPRNERGRQYEANGHRFGVKSWSSDANKRKYLRARSALLATWYGETARLLNELDGSEELPGGRALIKTTRERFSMFKRTWLRSAKKLLAKGARGRPNALKFLVKVESQFPETKEAEEAAKQLEQLAAEPETEPSVAKARAREQVRLLLLAGRTEYQLGDFDAARDLLDQVLADPLGKEHQADIDEIRAEMAAR